MSTSTKRLTTIVYIKDSLENDSSFQNWQISNTNVLCYANMYELCNDKSLAFENALFIATDNSNVKIANSHNLASVGYVPKRDKFLHTAYVIEGFDEIDYDYLDKIYRRYHKLPLTIATTERCIIREFTLDDLASLFELYSKPSVTDFVQPLFEYEEEMKYETDYIKCMYEYFGYGMWLIFDKVSSQLIGRAGLEHREYNGESELEMGYLIAPEFQNKGYATEVCLAIINFAKEQTDFSRINCLIHDDNTASIALVKKLNFAYIGRSNASGEDLQRYILKI